jgi:hypothetical protein
MLNYICSDGVQPHALGHAVMRALERTAWYGGAGDILEFAVRSAAGLGLCVGWNERQISSGQLVLRLRDLGLLETPLRRLDENGSTARLLDELEESFPGVTDAAGLVEESTNEGKQNGADEAEPQRKPAVSTDTPESKAKRSTQQGEGRTKLADVTADIQAALAFPEPQAGPEARLAVDDAGVSVGMVQADSTGASTGANDAQVADSEPFRTKARMAEEYGCTVQAIRNWSRAGLLHVQKRDGFWYVNDARLRALASGRAKKEKARSRPSQVSSNETETKLKRS